MRILGINDDVTTCECCGKSNLKCTVVLTNGEGEVHYGRDCAAKAIAGQFGVVKSAKRIEQEARNIAAGCPTPKRMIQPRFFPNGMRHA